MNLLIIKINNRSFFILGLVLSAVVFFAACAKTEGVKPVNTAENNTAVRGFDTVAFFTEGKLVESKPEFVHDWNGAKWQFASAENLDKFKSAPEKFAPQFGGYCSYAVSHGYTADGDPATWKIVDGKLYLNYNHDVRKKWEENQDQFIRDGEKNWENFKQKKPEHKG